MDKKIIAYILVGILLLILILSSFNIINLNFKKSNSDSENYANLPEKCRPPAGQDIEAWKEHLGHHAETQDCLKYFKNP